MNHHNSDPFIVKGVGENAKRNMDYLLERAQQELNVYFKRVPAPRTILINGNSNVIHTFRLKGKKLASLHFYFELLCKKGKVFEKDQNLLALTMQEFNRLYSGPSALMTDRTTKKGDKCYTL